MAKALTNNELYTLAAIETREMYGYEIVKALKESGVEVLIGSMYNILYRLEKRGFVKHRWGDPIESEQGARRKYYYITASGSAALANAREVIIRALNLGRTWLIG